MKASIPSLDAVEEPLRQHYEKQADGTFALKLEGAPAGFVPAADHATLKTEHATFRENNRGLNALKTELETKLAAYKDIDPAKYQEALTELAALKKKEPEAGAQITALQTQIANLAEVVKSSNKAREDAEQKAARKDLEGALTQAGLKAGVQEAALPDFLARGTSLFVVENGKHVAKRNGAPAFSKKDGSELTIEGWVAETVTEAPHLFKPNHGSGAANGPGGNGNGAGNGQTRIIPAGAKLSGQDVTDIAAGKAVREESIAT